MKIDINKPKDYAVKPINEVRVGDHVAVPVSSISRVGKLRYTMLTVERLTATQFLVKNGTRRFRIADGREIGSGYQIERAVVVGDDYAKEYRMVVDAANKEIEIRLWLLNMGDKHRTISIDAIAAMKASCDEWAKNNPSTGADE